MKKEKVKVYSSKTECQHCGYTWKSRVEFPKRCPYCQRWLNKAYHRKGGKQ